MKPIKLSQFSPRVCEEKAVRHLGALGSRFKVDRFGNVQAVFVTWQFANRHVPILREFNGLREFRYLSFASEDPSRTFNDIGFVYLAEVTDLRTVFVQHVTNRESAITDAGIPDETVSWQNVLLPYSKITDRGVEKVCKFPLRSLSLIGTQISDKSMDYLACLSGLMEIWIEGTKITDSGIEALVSNLPSCTIH